MTALELRIGADSRAPSQVRAELNAWLEARGWPVESREDLALAVSEAVSNAVEHAYQAGPRRKRDPGVVVTVSERTDPDGRRAEAIIDDFGVWRIAPPSRGYRGHGLPMIKALVESCEVLHRGDGTRVIMTSTPIDRLGTEGRTPDAEHDTEQGAVTRYVRNALRAKGAASAAAAGDLSRVAEERLRWLEVVTDTGLAHLTADRLLDELLEKVRELMDVDTAAVLLLDPSRRFLIATVARGIEEEVHQGVRIPLGAGFAGRIAEDQHWVAIERVDHDNVLNPILRERGIVSLLGVPLMSAGTMLGVLHVGTLRRREFTEQDADLLQMVADRAALAVQSRMAEAERAAAGVMQRHLLPARLPDVPGLEFAARYVTGGEGEVGGDWYDVFILPSGTVCLVVGDVVGHGLAAAQAMSQLRAVLRSNALHTEEPAELLTWLDEHVRHFQPGTMATVLCAMLAPGSDTLRMSSAGHPPPILVPPVGEAVTVAVEPDLPMGVELGHRRRTIEVDLPTGAALCLYSDGLVERRRVLVDVNIEKLRTVVGHGHPESVCADVMRGLVGLVTPEDDVALLVARRVVVG